MRRRGAGARREKREKGAREAAETEVGRLRRLLDDERAGRRADEEAAQSRLDTFQKAANDDAARLRKGRDDAAAKLAAAAAEAARLREALREAESKTPSKKSPGTLLPPMPRALLAPGGGDGGGAGGDGGVPSGTPARELRARAPRSAGCAPSSRRVRRSSWAALRARRKEKELALQAKLEQRLTHSAY